MPLMQSNIAKAIGKRLPGLGEAYNKMVVLGEKSGVTALARDAKDMSFSLAKNARNTAASWKGAGAMAAGGAAGYGYDRYNNNGRAPVSSILGGAALGLGGLMGARGYRNMGGMKGLRKFGNRASDRVGSILDNVANSETANNLADRIANSAETSTKTVRPPRAKGAGMVGSRIT